LADPRSARASSLLVISTSNSRARRRSTVALRGHQGRRPPRFGQFAQRRRLRADAYRLAYVSGSNPPHGPIHPQTGPECERPGKPRMAPAPSCSSPRLVSWRPPFTRREVRAARQGLRSALPLPAGSGSSCGLTAVSAHDSRHLSHSETAAGGSGSGHREHRWILLQAPRSRLGRSAVRPDPAPGRRFGGDDL
jgi:hypothetical protein